MARGFLYLVAVMDWYSRYVVAWRLSNTLDAGFCAEALEEALGRGKPEVFNTDQGSQFTSWEFTQVLQDRGVGISMDGKGGTNTTSSFEMQPISAAGNTIPDNLLHTPYDVLIYVAEGTSDDG